MNIAIDTNILIWGLRSENEVKPKAKKPTKQDVPDLQQQCLWLFDWFAEESHKVYVSTVTVGEILTGIAPEKHGGFVAELQRRFHIQPFDIPTASKAATLWQQVRASIPTAEAPERRCLRADVMIVAAAKIAGCGHFYTHEPSLRRVAILAGMESPELPKGPRRLFAGQ